MIKDKLEKIIMINTLFKGINFSNLNYQNKFENRFLIN